MSVNLERINKLAAEFEISVIRDPSDSVDLRYGVHYRGPGTPERYVVFLNGRTEWIEKYSYLVEDLELSEGTAFLTWDHRGQGASGGARAYIDDYATYAADAAHIVRQVVADKPYVILSHSMGGLISVYATLRGLLRPEAMVLCSPFLGLPDDPLPTCVAKPLARFLSAAGLSAVSTGGGAFTRIPFEKNRLTHSVELYRRMQETPYKVPAATFGWVAASFRAFDFCHDPDNVKALKAKTLVLGGSAETVVDSGAFQSWAMLASQNTSVPVQFQLISGAKHELLAEIPRYYEPAIQAIRKWYGDVYVKPL